MRPKPPDVLEKGRVRESAGSGYGTYPGEWYGRFVVRGPEGDHLLIVASAADGWPYPPPAWEHVSVSVREGTRVKPRCPSWTEMRWVKGLCWGPEECVVQYHPPESDYINFHPYCLHLFRPVGVDLPRPPSWTVGPPPAAGGERGGGGFR